MGRNDEDGLRRIRVRTTVVVEYDLYKCGFDRIKKLTGVEILEGLPRFKTQPDVSITAATVMV